MRIDSAGTAARTLSAISSTPQAIGSAASGLLFVGLRKGVAVIEPARASAPRVFPAESGPVTVVAQAPDGTVWLGGHGQVYYAPPYSATA